MNATSAPQRPRIDAHHHLWDLRRFPYKWLAPDSPPRPFGDHGPLKRNYLLADYRADIAGCGIAGSVFVEANAGAVEAREIEWLDEIAKDARLPGVAVASVDLRRPDAAALLSQLQRSPRMRGVRMAVCWDRRPQWRFIDRADVMLTEEFRAGLRMLTQRGLVFDVLVVPAQLLQLAQLAAANPDQRIVIDHLGTPWFQTAADGEAWRSGMRACARCRNVAVKISGLWTLDRQWRPDVIGGPVRLVVDLFGADRCLWGTNLPVEKLMCRVPEQLASLEEVLADLSEDEQDAIFRGTATRIYGMEVQ